MLIVDDKSMSDDIKALEQKLEEIKNLAKRIQCSTDIKVVLTSEENKNG